MSNWLVLLLLVLPVAYSKATMDALLSIRYILLSIFLLVFALYFLWWRREAQSLALPAINKIVFAVGLTYAAWMVVCMTKAINYREGYYETGRYLLSLFYLFIVMLTVMRQEDKLMRIFHAVVIMAIFHSLVGIMQHYEA